jgi:predicted membrane protein
MNCDRCKKEIDTYNLCIKTTKRYNRLCSDCLQAEDIGEYCKENEPCEVKEEMENDVKHIKKVYKLDDETTVEVCCDDKIDLHKMLKDENDELKKRLERLEKLLLSE